MSLPFLSLRMRCAKAESVNSPCIRLHLGCKNWMFRQKTRQTEQSALQTELTL